MLANRKSGLFALAFMFALSCSNGSSTNSINISGASIDGWPLTASAGTIACTNPDIVTFAVGENTYAVNAAAAAVAADEGWMDIDEIRAEADGEKIDLAPLVDLGTGLCES